jgi:hypothetical protein
MEWDDIDLFDGQIGEIDGQPGFYYTGVILNNELYKAAVLIAPEHRENRKIVFGIYQSITWDVFKNTPVKRILIDVEEEHIEIHKDCLLNLGFSESKNLTGEEADIKNFVCERDKFKP